MSKKIYHNFIIFIICIALLAVVSCASDGKKVLTGTGTIGLSIEIDPSVLSAGTATVCDDVPDPYDLEVRLRSADGKYSGSWTSLAEFPSGEAFATGVYLLEVLYGDINKEGPDTPYYYGVSTVSVREDIPASVSVTCQLANVMLSLDFSDSFRERYIDYSAVLHSIGHGYVKYAKDETRAMYLNPGDIDLTISLTKPDGKVTKFHPTTLKGAQARHHYNIFFDIQSDNDGTPMLVLDVDDELVSDDVVFRLDDALLNSSMPVVETEGFVVGEKIVHNEGDVAAEPLRFMIDAAGGLKSVTLTTASPSLIAQGWPAETDLVSLSADDAEALERLGLQYTCAPDCNSAVVDLTNVLPHIIFKNDVEESTFTIVAADKLKKVNDPVVMHVVTRPVHVDIVEAAEALICDTEAIVTIDCANAVVANGLTVRLLGENGLWSGELPVTCESVFGSTGRYRLTIPIGTGGRDLSYRLIYNGNVKASGTIQRSTPPYSIAVDAFANDMLVRIDAERRYIGYLTDYLTVYVNGVVASILSRDSDRGLVAVGSLVGNKEYYVSSTAMADNDSPVTSNTVVVRTETATPLPNGDFEDAKQVITDYPLLSGGRYSASTAPIFNQQNTTSINVWLPSDGNWATVNDKTFCTRAKNHNTWYMQVSTAITGDCQSGSKAMKITSVGWDIDGEPIKDYVQESAPYTQYSRAIPKVSHVAAGRLFLGKYTFDTTSGTETYTEGIPFKSRPTALNGYYKYFPGQTTPQERGLAKVVLLGEENGSEIVIAESQYRFTVATDYTAFSIPIVYQSFGIKATRLMILFASSEHVGSIEEETRDILPYYNAQEGAATGASLYIDNLSLSY